MIAPILPAVHTAQAAPAGTTAPTEGGDFAATLELKTQQPQQPATALSPSLPKGEEQAIAVPVADEPVMPEPALPGEIFDPLKELQDLVHSQEKNDAPEGQGQALDMPINPQLVHLQHLVAQIDAATAAAGAGTQENTAVTGKVNEAVATLPALAQTVLNGWATNDGNDQTVNNAAPTAAALTKQSYAVSEHGVKREAPVSQTLLTPTRVETPETLTSFFKPVIEGGAVAATDSQPALTSVAGSHAAPSFASTAPQASAAPTTMMSTPVLTQEFGSAGWQQALGQQVAMFTRNGIHNAELRLNPAELGVLKINLRMSNDQASLHFVSENHQVRSVLEAAMPQLRTSLAESGINLDTSSVGSGSAHSWNESGHSEWASGQASQDENRRDNGLIEEVDNETYIAPLRVNSGINTFV